MIKPSSQRFKETALTGHSAHEAQIWLSPSGYRGKVDRMGVVAAVWHWSRSSSWDGALWCSLWIWTPQEVQPGVIKQNKEERKISDKTGWPRGMTEQRSWLKWHSVLFSHCKEVLVVTTQNTRFNISANVRTPSHICFKPSVSLYLCVSLHILENRKNIKLMMILCFSYCQQIHWKWQNQQSIHLSILFSFLPCMAHWLYLKMEIYKILRKMMAPSWLALIAVNIWNSGGRTDLKRATVPALACEVMKGQVSECGRAAHSCVRNSAGALLLRGIQCVSL